MSLPRVDAMWMVMRFAEPLDEDAIAQWEDPERRPEAWKTGWPVPSGGSMHVLEVEVSREDTRYVRFRIDMGDVVQPGEELVLPEDFRA